MSPAGLLHDEKSTSEIHHGAKRVGKYCRQYESQGLARERFLLTAGRAAWPSRRGNHALQVLTHHLNQRRWHFRRMQRASHRLNRESFRFQVIQLTVDAIAGKNHPFQVRSRPQCVRDRTFMADEPSAHKRIRNPGWPANNQGALELELSVSI